MNSSNNQQPTPKGVSVDLLRRPVRLLFARIRTYECTTRGRMTDRRTEALVVFLYRHKIMNTTKSSRCYSGHFGFSMRNETGLRRAAADIQNRPKSRKQTSTNRSQTVNTIIHWYINSTNDASIYISSSFIIIIIMVELSREQERDETARISAAPKWTRRHGILAAAVVVVVAIVVIITAVVTTTQSGSSNGDDTASINTPVVPQEPPSPLALACDFFKWSNLTTCPTQLTLFDGTPLGDTIPPEIGLLTQLTHMNIQNVGLTGTIPWTLGNLTQLTFLSLMLDQLTGTIPSTLGNLVNLTTLSLSDNQLNGTIPITLGRLTQLTELDLSVNQLTGPIPSTMANLTLLYYLGLSDNRLTGPIPSAWNSLVQLSYLYLSNNQLTGSIPSTLASLTQLTRLDLFDNTPLLTGTIPSILCGDAAVVIDCLHVECTCCRSATSSDLGGAACPST